MTFKELQYFLQIAKDQSYTRAAKHLYVSQPALSKMIKKLENEIGLPLFVMRKGQVILTDYGEALYKKAHPLIGEFHALQNFVSKIKDTTSGTLRVGITPMLAALYVIDILDQFSNDYPDVDLQIFESGSRTIREMVKSGDLDIGICITGDNREKLEEIILLRNKLVLCVHRNHPLAKKRSVSLGQLKDESFNLYSSASALSAIINEACIKAGFIRKVNITTSSIHVLLQMTEKGNGILILPGPYAEKYASEDLSIIPFRQSLPWTACIVKESGVYHSRISGLFEETVKKFFENVR